MSASLVNVRPTARWRSRMVVVPTYGTVRKASNILVPPNVAEWLEQQLLAETVNPDSAEQVAPALTVETQANAHALAAPPPPSDLNAEQEEVGDDGHDGATGSSQSDEGIGEPAIDNWQIEAIAFLNSPEATVEVVTDIRGITPEVAQKIVELERPITWEAVDAILTDRQETALKKHFMNS